MPFSNFQCVWISRFPLKRINMPFLMVGSAVPSFSFSTSMRDATSAIYSWPRSERALRTGAFPGSNNLPSVLSKNFLPDTMSFSRYSISSASTQAL